MREPVSIGVEAPPFDNLGISLRASAIGSAVKAPFYVHASANAYENIATGPGQFTGWSGSHLGSPLEPPLFCNWQSRMIVDLCVWQHPPAWINATNCIQELAAFAGQLVARYPGLVYAVIPMKEPYYGPNDKLPWITNDKQCAEFMTELWRQVKLAVGPKVQVWGPSFATPFGVINDTLIDAGFARYLDRWSFHYYDYQHGTPATTPAMRRQNLLTLRSAIGGIPFVIDEGYLPDTEKDINDMVADFRQTGCEVFNFTGLWGVVSTKPTLTPDPNQLACWSDSVTMMPKLKLFLKALQ